MKLWLRAVTACSVLLLLACARADETSPDARTEMDSSTMMTEHPNDIPLQTITGDSTTLAGLGGKAKLIVNVASQCGFTSQYEGLEKLYQKYRDRGLVVIGFPSNQFGGQEPGTNEEILTFCQTEYGVTFPMMAKIEVKGGGQHPLYRYLTSAPDHAGGIKWNFAKFLVDEDGRVVARFGSRTKPMSEAVTSAIEKLL